MAETQYPTWRIHVSKPTFKNPGWDDADFMGDKYLDEDLPYGHGTAFEIEFKDGVTPEVKAALELAARELNKQSCHEVAPGVYAGFRAGWWDNIPPAQ